MNRTVLVIAACLAALAYVWGLGGQYIPSNGDEMVYAHIARKTAESGHWLPLASDLFETRNTKPPMLFWQAMAAGDLGGWTLAALRTPGLIYTFAVAAALAWLVARSLGLRGHGLGQPGALVNSSGQAPTQAAVPASEPSPWTTGLLAAVVFLAFFSTLRYHRAYLTSAPETFWFSLPIFVWFLQLSHANPQGNALFSGANTATHHTWPALTPSWLSVLLLGLGLGIGLAYKSFALVAPAAAAWWLVVLASQPWMGWRALVLLSVKVGVAAVLALGVFGLWFVLDPEPGAVWQEFIVAENAKKFSDQRGYWAEALGLNGSSIWSQLLAYAVNAGLLAPVVLGLMVLGVRRLLKPQSALDGGNALQAMSPLVALALAWLLVWLLTFTIPSQRSARYVIPAMPAVAILLALYWGRIGLGWFRLTALLCLVAALLLARVAWVMGALSISTSWDMTLALGLAAGVAGGALLVFTRSSKARISALLAVLGVYALMDAVLMPLDGPRGQFSAPSLAQHHSTLAVPNNFNGQYERYRYILPGQPTLRPYDVGARAARGPAALNDLLAQHGSALWVQSAAQTAPDCAPQCTVLGVRWIFKSRHLAGEVRADNLWTPQDWLLAREWWVQVPAAKP